MTKTLLSFGHGYSAQRLSRKLAGQGWRVIGTSRDPNSLDLIRQSGAEPLIWPSNDPPIEFASHILISTGPTEHGDPVLTALRDRIAAHATKLQWVGYLSTTAVYGDHRGAWVDEHTAPNPSTRRGHWRAQAEADWAAIPNLPLHIFRLAGIYGPGRGPFAKVRAGTARRIIKEGQLFSRIHVDDIAQTLIASIARPNPGAIYNVCDDEAAPPEDVIACAANLLDVPIPPAIPFEQAEMTRMARSFYSENKRVRNDRIKSELGVTLTYPDYRVGLQALLRQEGAD